jgi:signal transduction histidine kinase
MAAERIKILYLDDEVNNLAAFKATFRRNFEIYTASSAEEAYRILEIASVHIILADQRMPEVSGVEFFEKVNELYPNPRRILITGYTNSQTIIDAVNKGQIHRYVVKPWDAVHLKSIIETCYDTYKAKQELQLKNEELSKINEELSRFVYSTSHDLRAPLMSILGLINVARMEKEDGDFDYYMDLMEQSVQKMDEYIQNILEYYQNARAGEEYDQINFKTLVDEMLESLHAYDQKIKFLVEIDSGPPFYSDKFRMRIILSNLISNAIKYQRSDNPEPVVKIHINSDKSQAYIRIEDNGMGILQEHLESIFKMFFRARTSTQKPGTGIGLYIVKEALTRIGGQIKVSSRPGQGTTFELFIPNKHESK